MSEQLVYFDGEYVPMSEARFQFLIMDSFMEMVFLKESEHIMEESLN